MKIKYIFAIVIILVGLLIISCQEMIDIEDDEDMLNNVENMNLQTEKENSDQENLMAMLTFNENPNIEEGSSLYFSERNTVEAKPSSYGTVKSNVEAKPSPYGNVRSNVEAKPSSYGNVKSNVEAKPSTYGNVI